MHRQPTVSLSRAHGRGVNVGLGLAFIVLLYGSYMYLTPRLVAYDVQGIQKVACNALMRETFWNQGHGEAKKDFESRVRQIGVQLQEHQYRINVSSPCTDKNCSCTAEAIFELNTEWPILADFTDIKPYHTVHRPKTKTDYRASY